VSGLGSLSNIAYGFQIRWDEDLDMPDMGSKANLSDNLAQELSDVWAWLFFALNTTMTTSIIYKVLYVHCFAGEIPSKITRSCVALRPTVRRPCAKITTSITP
jgi:hypothetical protein